MTGEGTTRGTGTDRGVTIRGVRLGATVHPRELMGAVGTRIGRITVAPGGEEGFTTGAWEATQVSKTAGVLLQVLFHIIGVNEFLFGGLRRKGHIQPTPSTPPPLLQTQFTYSSAKASR